MRIDDEKYIRMALLEARKAQKKGEVPVGALLVKQGKIIARGHNRNITRHDPSSHAEIEVLRKAGKRLQNYRLSGATLYCTIEPCPMCAGAIIYARIGRVVFGVKDPKTGSCGSVFNILRSKKLNHRVDVTRGILEKECSDILKAFFKKKRSSG